MARRLFGQWTREVVFWEAFAVCGRKGVRINNFYNFYALLCDFSVQNTISVSLAQVRQLGSFEKK